VAEGWGDDGDDEVRVPVGLASVTDGRTGALALHPASENATMTAAASGARRDSLTAGGYRARAAGRKCRWLVVS
jgi:hypothetical protein